MTLSETIFFRCDTLPVTSNMQTNGHVHHLNLWQKIKNCFVKLRGKFVKEISFVKLAYKEEKWQVAEVTQERLKSDPWEAHKKSHCESAENSQKREL
jgi:hypothetical protein